MGESLLTVTFLVLICVCLCLMAISVFLTAHEFRGTLRRANTVLTDAHRAIRESHRSLQEVHDLLTRGNRASRHVETVVHRACETVSDALDRVTDLRGRAETLLTGKSRNGARAASRQHHRRR